MTAPGTPVPAGWMDKVREAIASAKAADNAADRLRTYAKGGPVIFSRVDARLVVQLLQGHEDVLSLLHHVDELAEQALGTEQGSAGETALAIGQGGRSPLGVNRPADPTPEPARVTELPDLPVDVDRLQQIAVHSPRDGTYEVVDSLERADSVLRSAYLYPIGEEGDPDSDVVVRQWTAEPWRRLHPIDQAEVEDDDDPRADGA